MAERVTTAVFPVAGLGTRFLPATKASAKEMLPVVDKPLIQYAVEEAIEAGIRNLVFVTGRSKRSIEDHFDRSVELEAELEARNKFELLELVRGILPVGVTCMYIRQAEPLGLGHAVLCAAPAVGQQPFAVVLPDDLIHNPGRGCLAQMCAVYEQAQKSVIAVQTIPRESTNRYGIVSLSRHSGDVGDLDAIVEKPEPEDAPTTLGVVGRYILTPDIFDLIRETPKGAGGEIQLTDAIAKQVDSVGVQSLAFEGVRYDCGSKLGFLQATVELALVHDEVGAGFKSYMQEKFGQVK